MTPAQRRTYDALIEATSEGWPATVREVAAIRGSAVATTYYSLTLLEGLGLAERRGKKGWRAARPWIRVV